MITRDKFIKYEEVRESGRTNMFAIKIVSFLSGLDKDEVIEIMDNYENLEKKYLKRK